MGNGPVTRGGDGDVNAVAGAMLERLSAARSRGVWLDKNALCGVSGKARVGATELAAFKRLRSERRIVDAGTLDKKHVFCPCDGKERNATLLAVADQLVRSLESERLVLHNMSEQGWKQAFPKCPSGVRELLKQAVGKLRDAGEAFLTKKGQQTFFLLRGDIEAELARRPRISQAEASTATDVRRWVETAYKALRSERGHRDVSIARLADRVARGGVGRPALLDFLLDECLAHRANPTVGEPTAASAEELDAALVIDGQPHLYIDLSVGGT